MFAVCVPIVKHAHADHAGRSGEHPDALTAPPCTVLMVDDDRTIQDSCRMLLELEGFTVETADDADAAMQRVGGGGLVPDVVICDYRLPDGVSGTQVVRGLRALTGRALPAIVLTGDTSETLTHEVRQLGARVLYKPVTAQTLLDALRRELGRP